MQWNYEKSFFKNHKLFTECCHKIKQPIHEHSIAIHSILMVDLYLYNHSIIHTTLSSSTPCEAASEKAKGCLQVSKRRKMQWNHEKSFFKNHKLLQPECCHIDASIAWTFNSYSLNFDGRFIACTCNTCMYVTTLQAFDLCSIHRAQEVSSLCDFWKKYYAVLLHFFPFWHL